ncbi:serine/threonine-protein kinase LMTK1 [Xenentodon cancila]
MAPLRDVFLTPILYTLFTHDCVVSHKDNIILKFADDTAVIGRITRSEEVAYRREVAGLVACQLEMLKQHSGLFDASNAPSPYRHSAKSLQKFCLGALRTPVAKMFVLLATMSSVLVSSSFAISSHFRPDGTPLSELSWSSSLAVVAISFSGLFAFVFLLLACICCKKGKIGFKEFQNVYGDEYNADISTLASPASPDSPDVYILPLTKVSLPSSKQPAPSVQLLESTGVDRHSLFYLKEIGNGWFGKVLLGKINSELNTTQVVVKELKANASAQDQMLFLDEAQPFRTLQHPALLQCLAQCTEATPYLLVMEFCPLGDVKGYLRSCRSNESITPEPLILQRMACEIASGLLHLHKYNFTHSDLALRNCLLTVDISVKIGDYGLAHTKYKDDYYVTWDQIYVPLRWIAPELVEEAHGNVVVLDQTQQSNIWSFGVTIWELFELGNQPFSHYSDRQVLRHAVREHPLRLPKPQLNLPLADRWYEVMQFCWLQPNQRPNAEEVHMLLSYLCAKGANEAEEDFERRWNSLCPSNGCNSNHGVSGRSQDHPSSIASSFPLLEKFSDSDEYHPEAGDDVLTVTETSHGLNFEYKWEQSRADQPCSAPHPPSTMDQAIHHCQEAFYPPGNIIGSCPLERVVHGVSPSYYQAKHLHAPSVPPVLGAHSPSLRHAYDITIEEPVNIKIHPDYSMCSYSPDFSGNNGSCLTGSTDSDEYTACPAEVKEMGTYWSANIHKFDLYDSTDSSPAISLTMEPLLGHVSDSSPLRPWESSHYVSYKDRDGGYYYENSPSLGINPYRLGSEHSSENHQESWGSRNLRQALGELESPLVLSPSVNSPPETAYRDLYMDTSQTSILGRKVTGGYYDMMGSLRKTMPNHTRHNSHSVCLNMETEGALFSGHRDNDSEVEEEDVFVERHTCNTWPSNHHHSHVAQPRRAGHMSSRESYDNFHHTMPSTDIKESWTEEHNQAFYSLPKPIGYHKPHQAKDSSACFILGTRHRIVPSNNSNAYIYLCHQGETQVPASGECCHAHFVDPLGGLIVRNTSCSHSYSYSNYIRDKAIDIPSNEEIINLSPAPGGPIVSRLALKKSEEFKDHYVDLTANATMFKEKRHEAIKENPIMQKPPQTRIQEQTLTMTKTTPPPTDMRVVEAIIDPQPEVRHIADNSMDHGVSTLHLANDLDCNEQDSDISDKITDITSSFFDESSEMNATPAFKLVQKQVGTPDSMDSIALPSATESCEGLSPASPHPCSSTKAMDSGYDTENNESPEFVPKESYETRLHPQGTPTLDAKLEEGEGTHENKKNVPEDGLQTCEHNPSPLGDMTPYRDSAYFSDYENERQSSHDEEQLKFRLKEEQNDEREEQTGEKKSEELKNKKEEKVIDTAVTKDSECVLKGTSESFCLQEIEDFSQDEPHWNVSETEGSLDKWSLQEESSSLEDWAADVVGAMEKALGALNGDFAANFKADEEEMEDMNEGHEIKDSVQVSETIASTQMKITQNSPSRISGELFYLLPKDEVALQQTGNPRCFSPSSATTNFPSPLPGTEAQASPADGDEPDEEYGENDESDEAEGEELQHDSVQEQSGEESEDECQPVPIVVSDTSEAYKLRSLLKMPSLLTAECLEEELKCKKKTVSFFDDVTLHLFDQESTTKRLEEHGFTSETKSQSEGRRSQERLNSSNDFSDGNISKESAGLEWEDDFPLSPLPMSSAASDSHLPHSVTKAPDPKPAVQHSRFSVSPSSMIRFSITHVSDSDMDSAGGS